MRPSDCSKPVKALLSPQSGYAFLASILDQIEVAPIVSAMSGDRTMGRPGYHVEAMLRAILSKYLLSIRYTNQLVVRLENSARLREICGFEQVPTESTFSRFQSRLGGQTELLKEEVAALVLRCKEWLPDLGAISAIDSTAVETFSNPNRKIISDPDARWGLKHSAKAKEGKEVFFFGYKVHMVADAVHGLPLSYSITSGNVGDSTELPPVVKQTQEEHPWLRMKYLLADRGYDSQHNHKFLDNLGIKPIIHIRRPTADDGKHAGIYDKRGAPTCMGGESMKFVRTDPGTGCHLFRCPAGGCALKEGGSKPLVHCDTETWEDPALNLRVLGRVARSSPLWKLLYKKRMTIERTFRSLKHSRGLEGHMVRGLARMERHVALGVMTYLATALARLEAGNFRKLRHMIVG